MKRALTAMALATLCAATAANAQRADGTTTGQTPAVGTLMGGKPDSREARRLDKAVRAKADSLRRTVAGAEVTTVSDVNGLTAIRIVFSGTGFPAEPNVTGYNTATREAITAIAAQLTGPWALADITVDGHTDNVGPYDENMTVSFRRATAIAGLLTRQGVDSMRISARGFSYDYPLANNHLIEGREKNRRVEMTITLSEGMIGMMKEM